MAITHVFKGRSDIYGTFAYTVNDQLVIDENATLETVLSYRGSLKDFFGSEEYHKLFFRNKELATDIWGYYNRQKVNSINSTIEVIKNVDLEEPMKKLCEIKVDRADSLKEMVYHLTANGYEVQTAVIWKEFPNTGIDCWQIAIFDKEKK
jgi:hypothetical protein